MDTAPLSFDGLWLPLITPLSAGHVDVDALQSLTAFYRDAGVSGFVLFGSTGEGNLLSLAEQSQAFSAVREVAPGLPLLIGAGGVQTASLCQSIRALDRLRPDGWLVAPPYYLRPAADGIRWHYEQVTAATERPVVIYNVPQRTGAALATPLLEFLCAHTGCAAVKECDPQRLTQLNARRGVVSLCGEDRAFLDHFAQGGAGAISASAHIRPDLFIAVMQLAKARRRDAARHLFASIEPVIQLLFAEPNPAPIKQVLASCGVIRNELRLPMTPASDVLGKRLANAVARLPSEARVRQVMNDADALPDAIAAP